MRSTGGAVAAGVATLLFALAGYYVAAQLVLGAGGSTTVSSVAFWAAVALVGGPTFGLASHWAAHGGPHQRPIGIGLLGAALVAEGIHQVSVAWTPAIGAVEIASGLVVPLLLARSRPDRLRAFAWMAPAVVAGIAAFAAFGWLSSLVGGG